MMRISSSAAALARWRPGRVDYASILSLHEELEAAAGQQDLAGFAGQRPQRSSTVAAKHHVDIAVHPEAPARAS
jgi:hypothetical protein